MGIAEFILSPPKDSTHPTLVNPETDVNSEMKSGLLIFSQSEEFRTTWIPLKTCRNDVLVEVDTLEIEPDNMEA
jgi:hypothetical protein